MQDLVLLEHFSVALLAEVAASPQASADGAGSQEVEPSGLDEESPEVLDQEVGPLAPVARPAYFPSGQIRASELGSKAV